MISTRKLNQTTAVERITITLACHKLHCSALWVTYSNSSHGINKKAESTLMGIILKILKLGSKHVQEGSVNLVLKDKIIENWNWSLNLKWVCFLAFFDFRLFSLVVGSAWRVPDTRPDPIIFGNTQSVPNFFPESSGISGIGYFTFFGRMCL